MITVCEKNGRFFSNLTPKFVIYMVKIKTFLYLTALTVGLTGCSSVPFLTNEKDQASAESLNNRQKGYVPNFIKPYRIDIQQGNFITQKEVAKLEKGMSKEQVRFILGTPLLQSPFHQNRWDYPYTYTKSNGETFQATYTVFFSNGALVRHGGENLPEE